MKRKGLYQLLQCNVTLKQRSVQPVHVPEYQNKYWRGGLHSNQFAKNSPAKIRMHKQFTSYLLPFLMNTNTSDYLERWACREDGWHTAAIATAVRFLGNLLLAIFISTTYVGSCTLLCFSVMYCCVSSYLEMHLHSMIATF